MATDVKKQIAQTFVKRAKKVGMDKVTINAVVTECNISRQAFYYYYQDIVDVARYVIREELNMTLDANEEEEPQEAVRYFAGQLTSRFPIISMVLNSKFRGEMEQILIGELRSFFQTIFTREECGRQLSRKQLAFQADFIACGLAGYAIEHCNDGAFDKEAFAGMLWDMLSRAYGE